MNNKSFYVISLEYKGGGSDTFCDNSEIAEKQISEIKKYVFEHKLENSVIIIHEYDKRKYTDIIFDENKDTIFFDNYFDAESNIIYRISINETYVSKFIELAESNHFPLLKNPSIVYDKKQNNLEIEVYTKIGGDFVFYIWCGTTMQEFCLNLKELYDSFDVDYETYLMLGCDGHGKNGAPYHIKDILDDMMERCNILQSLSENVDELLK